jgi:hypothetical protein
MVTVVRSVLLLVGLCSTAAAAPIATLTKDVDGDSADDKIELDTTGELRIETKRGASKVALPIKATQATLTAAIARGTPTIVVHTADEAIALQLTGATWKQVVKTKVGGVGLDADYSVVLDANADGIYRYQARAGYARCDGKPALLFAERFEGGKFVAAPKLPAMLPDNAPVIAARVDSPTPTAEPMLFKARVASHQPGAPDAGALAQPQELDDGKPTTWREELAGAGEGHFFTFKARTRGTKASQVRIVPAKVKGANRPQRIAVVSAQGAWHIDIPDSAKDAAGTGYVADLPAPIADCVTIVIESTYGTNGVTAFSELEVFGEGERSGGGDASLAQVIASGGDGAKAAAQALARRGAPGVAAIEAELAKTSDGAARGRLVRALVSNRDPTAGPVLAKAVSEDWVQDADLIAALGALGGLGQGQALHDVAARQAVPVQARVAAVTALNPAVEKERDLLVALAGRGPRELRQAVIERLTSVDVPTLVPLAEAQPKAAASGDLWRAITRAAHLRSTNPAEVAAARAALSAALAKATDYERRYRIVDGIAAVGDAAALHTLAETFKQWPAGAETAAIKQIAARSIAVNPRPDALDLITTLVVDADPGVRLAALSAIADAGGGAAGPWHGPSGPDAIDRVIQTRLATDTWPEVRRYSAQVLGGRCSRPGPAASLADSIARDPDVAVRGDALAALVECKAATAPALLAKLWDDTKAPLELRQRAVDLTVVLGDLTLGRKLVAKYTKWRAAAIDSEPALALTQSAAYAIGRLRVPGAAEALTAALDDNAFPEIVASAAGGLGLLGPACPASVKPKLKALSRSEDAQVNTAASRAYEICGK